MPIRPKKTCNQPGCKELTYSAYCDTHKNKIKKEFDKRRGTAAERGYGHRWRKARLYYLQCNPLCVKCFENGRVTMAQVVDHIIPHKGDYNLMWNQDNWQSLCKKCHDIKTGKGE